MAKKQQHKNSNLACKHHVGLRSRLCLCLYLSVCLSASLSLSLSLSLAPITSPPPPPHLSLYIYFSVLFLYLHILKRQFHPFILAHLVAYWLKKWIILWCWNHQLRALSRDSIWRPSSCCMPFFFCVCVCVCAYLMLPGTCHVRR